VVYLKLDYDTLDGRLGSLKGRGVVLKDGQDLRALYEERVPLYEKYADIVVDEGGLDLEATLEAVLEQLSYCNY
ncbi:MAG: shikimate kinase, partial [Pseudobutyrivibrio sp.]|nr:shikimate kinase [Pseudobutyrivibrio sp.]